MSYPYIIQGNNITVVIGSKPYTISKTHITYPQVLEAIKAGEWDRVKEIIDPVKVVLTFGKGNVTINGEELLWKGRPLHSALSTRMVAMLQEGFDVEPMANFMENLFKNPSKRAVDELYGFLEKNNLPITPDGHFLAYKRVRADYLDCHSGTMDNSVGKIVEMERNEVDDNRDRTCSTGLHFCSHSYLAHFSGDRVVIVKINPADVVSIPSDYNDAKGRACRYEVIGEVGVNPDDGAEFDKPVQSNANGNFAPPPVAPVKYEPKTGSGIFYRGYSDGYYGRAYHSLAVTDNGERFYYDGYEQGKDDAYLGLDELYRYVEPEAKPAANGYVPPAWPQAFNDGNSF